jgi:hypothetical protein
MEMTRIQDIITVPHEAHFRLELWFALRGGNYSHDTSKHSVTERHEKFAEFCRYVTENRHDNADLAFANRAAAGPLPEEDACSSSDSDDGVGQDYY